jgi:hypothetical protein
MVRVLSTWLAIPGEGFYQGSRNIAGPQVFYLKTRGKPAALYYATGRSPQESK